MGSALPTKEQSQFRQLVRLYETKQFKKALRTADTILKKFPSHGETLAMKGLALNAMEKKEEAYELVRLGLKNDLRSHVCWHVYGLLYRSDREYVEASRAYLQALRIDTENVQILRDLALLQIQIRHFEGFSNTRRTLLTLKPGQKIHWIAFALSHHLLGNFDEAVKVIDTYQATIVPEDDTDSPYEKSELQLYRNWIVEESGNYEAALEHLQKIKSLVVDRTAWMEAELRLLIGLKRFEAAEQAALALMERNSENSEYYDQYFEAVFEKESTPEEDKVGRKLALCDGILESYPRALLPQRMPLDFLVDVDYQFVERLDSYVRWFLVRGVPSLNTGLRSLYVSPKKVEAIEKLFLEYEEEFTANGKLPPPKRVNSQKKSDEAGDPAVQFWILLFLAQHFDRVGQLERALGYVEQAIEHTPTVIEVYQTKARILKHAGAFTEAAQIANSAREMDLADRNLNTKSTKYHLRCNKVEEAESQIALFTRDGESKGVQALYDMQCMWFECEIGESFQRQGKYGSALKNFKAVERHFDDFVEDQFDFHTYCVRKETLRSYVRLLRMEDEVKESQYFARAANGAIRTHLHLLDNPQSKESDAEVAASLANLSTSERKKALSKIRKAQAKKQEEESKVKETKNGKSDGGKKGGKPGPTGWMETDKDGSELLRNVKDRLAEALKLVRELEKFSSKDPETHLLAFGVAMRRKKYLQALRAMRRVQQLDPASGVALVLMVRFREEVEGNSEVLDALIPAAREVLSSEGTQKLTGGKSVTEYVEDCISAKGCTPDTRIGAGLALLRCKENTKMQTRAMELLSDFPASLTFAQCQKVGTELASFATEEQRGAFRSAVSARYPRADVTAI